MRPLSRGVAAATLLLCACGAPPILHDYPGYRIVDRYVDERTGQTVLYGVEVGGTGQVVVYGDGPQVVARADETAPVRWLTGRARGAWIRCRPSYHQTIGRYRRRFRNHQLQIQHRGC